MMMDAERVSNLRKRGNEQREQKRPKRRALRYSDCATPDLGAFTYLNVLVNIEDYRTPSQFSKNELIINKK